MKIIKMIKYTTKNPVLGDISHTIQFFQNGKGNYSMRKCIDGHWTRRLCCPAPELVIGSYKKAGFNNLQEFSFPT